MPPKPQVVVKKGQPNLFSFFKKPAGDAPAAAPAVEARVHEVKNHETKVVEAKVHTSTPNHGAMKESSDTNKSADPGSAATSRADDSPYSVTMSSQRSQYSQDDGRKTYICVDDTDKYFANKRKLEDDKEPSSEKSSTGGIAVAKGGVKNGMHYIVGGFFNLLT